MTAGYNDFLVRRAAEKAVSMARGQSGYFSTPTPDLDPRLFAPGTDTIYPDVRRWILTTLYRFWEQHYAHPQEWSTVWIAGSGITHQWSGGRATGDQPGDLDVLIGVDWERFFIFNHSWVGTPNDVMASHINSEFHAELWPRTAAVVLPMGGAPFEVTFYVNATGSDIRNINPYAAYDLTHDSWTVRPIDLPENWNPYSFFAKDWWDQVTREEAETRSLVQQYQNVRTNLGQLHPGTGAFVNAATVLHHVLDRAATLYDNIHLARKQAFSPGGKGFLDYYNFRWQAHKYLGSGAALRQLRSVHADAHADLVSTCYNGADLDPTHALTIASRTIGLA